MSGGQVIQQHFRLRLDDGNEANASWLADADTAAVLNVDTAYRIRFCLYNGSTQLTILPKLYYDRNNQNMWTAASGAATVVAPQTSSSLGYDGTACTNQLGGTGTYATSPNTGFCDDNNNVGNLTINPGTFANMEYCFKVVGASVNDGDTIRLRVFNNSAPLGTDIAAYPVTPSITIHKFTNIYPKAIGGAQKFIGGTYSRIGGTGIYIGGASNYI